MIIAKNYHTFIKIILIVNAKNILLLMVYPLHSLNIQLIHFLL